MYTFITWNRADITWSESEMYKIETINILRKSIVAPDAHIWHTDTAI